jgi:hypothetical protein
MCATCDEQRKPQTSTVGAAVGEAVAHSRLSAITVVVFEAGTDATGSHPSPGEPVAEVQLQEAS